VPIPVEFAALVFSLQGSPPRDVHLSMTTQIHAEPINAAKFDVYISRTVIRDNGAFVSVDVHTNLVGAAYSSELFDRTLHFGGHNVDRIDAHAAALKWARRVNR
jgi:hypothetical protein